MQVIVTEALTTRQIARNMNEFTQVRSRIHARFVKSVLASHQFGSDMNELTQE